MAARRTSKLRFATLLGIGVALVPLIAGALITTRIETGEEVSQASQEALRLARATARNVSATVGEAAVVLAKVGTLPGIRDGDTERCLTELRDVRLEHARFRDVGVVRPDGRVLCSLRADGAIETVVDEPWLAEALRTPEMLLRRLKNGVAVKLPAVACLRRIEGADGAPAGVAFVTLGLDELTRLVPDLPPGSAVAMLDPDGRFLLRLPEAAGERLTPGSRTALLGIVGSRAADGTETLRDVDGEPRIVGYAAVRGATERALGYVVVGTPEADAMAGPTRHWHESLTILGATGALLLLVGWVGSNAFVLKPVRSILDAARGLRDGHLDARSRVPSGALEIRQLSSTFDEMAETLERSVSETQHALAALRESQGSLRSLSRHLLEAQEAERRQLARELHDEIGQALTAVTLNLETLRRAPSSPEALPALPARLADATSIVRHALDQVRDLSLDLRPSILDDLGLAAALRWYTSRQAGKSGLEIALDMGPLDERLPADVETACFRIVQEAITNVVRHAAAKRVDVRVRRGEKALELLVRDDGRGFDADEALQRSRGGSSFGLLGMEERALLVGGAVRLTSTPGRGTEIQASIPLDGSGADEEAA